METTADVERLIYETFRRDYDAPREELMPLIKRWCAAFLAEAGGAPMTQGELQRRFERMLRAAQAGGQGWEYPEAAHPVA